jgi:hypothetical protein
VAEGTSLVLGNLCKEAMSQGIMCRKGKRKGFGLRVAS